MKYLCQLCKSTTDIQAHQNFLDDRNPFFRDIEVKI